MKKYLIVLSIIVIAVIGTILYLKEENTPINYVLFSQYFNEETQESLINRLKKNNIPYQVDEAGNVKIPEKDVEKAVQCCT